MKFLRKINIGLTLTIIAIIAVVVYCINVESGRKSAKEDIKKACDDFTQLTNKYAMLPTEYQTVGIKSTDVNLNDYYTKMQSELEQKTISSKTADIQKIILSDVVESQLLDTSKITTEFNRQIAKITSYEFSGNQVSVVFNSKVTVKQKYSDYDQETGEPTEKVKENTYELQGESMTLEKVDGNWKVVFADLQYTNLNSSANYYM